MYTMTIYYIYHMLFCFNLHITQFSLIHCSSSYNFITLNLIEFVVNVFSPTIYYYVLLCVCTCLCRILCRHVHPYRDLIWVAPCQRHNFPLWGFPWPIILKLNVCENCDCMIHGYVGDFWVWFLSLSLTLHRQCLFTDIYWANQR